MNFEIAPKSTEIEANWDDARLYCFSLNIDGKVGWRLPTKDELKEIYESENDYELDWHWSTTEVDNIIAWCLHFEFGCLTSCGIKNMRDYYVRAVRDLT